MGKFKVVSNFQATGDQPQAIDSLAAGVDDGLRSQVLLGATGTGKTFTVAKVIERVQLPTLVIAHNKTLAAQLAAEFKSFFPENFVGYFVSYYDYYQPEAYIAATDTYIEKDASINDEIDQMRHSATCALFERRDVIIVASVSCIYGLGSPESYYKLLLHLKVGQIIPREKILRRLIEIRYERNDMIIERGHFRVRGDVIEVTPAGYNGRAIRIELFGDEVDKISEFEILTGKIIGRRDEIFIFPASHYVTDVEDLERAEKNIRAEMSAQVEKFTAEGKLIEAQRIEQRTRFDLEMMAEMGYCSGIENYSRHLTGRAEGEPPFTLIDYFPKNFLTVVDESHVTLPQLRAMYAGDRSRKNSLIENGFRLPSARDNRPLTFEEFNEKISQIIFVSATPAEYELSESQNTVEQIIRPTGLLDPLVEVRPIQNQIDDLIAEIHRRVEMNERVLITTLTKKFAEELTDYLGGVKIRVKYLHSDVITLERAEIIHDLRAGKFDVLVGINLLREGLDMPEVSLIAILDADKEGFLRSDTSLIQTIGRAARNVHGKVILYADRVTDSMRRAMDETSRRRKIQEEYNARFKITPRTIEKPIAPLIDLPLKKSEKKPKSTAELIKKLSPAQKKNLVKSLTAQMREASKNLEFERAAELRDIILKLEEHL
ncbi:MAG: excinuclease ABC subunit UvrB [Selenomonadaceae bacterium]|nr:excinuclease ABC subunit UvrB [Selenomonadaceae bacterium]MBQ3725593.1 excinuclease ABC subunit UvrB [Selenomonadaceae bacterium]